VDLINFVSNAEGHYVIVVVFLFIYFVQKVLYKLLFREYVRFVCLKISAIFSRTLAFSLPEEQVNEYVRM